MCTPLMALFFVASAFSVFSRVVSCYDEAPWQPILYDYYQIDLGELGEHHGFGYPKPDYGTLGGKIPIPREAIVDVINNLGIKLLAIHNEHNENNIAISPYGAFSVLAALSEGLRGESAHEILHAAQIPKDKHVLRVGLRDIHRHLKSYFIPEEGFLAGLTLNLNNVTLRSEYEDVLHFYGFDYGSFNNALYPEPPTTKRPTEGTTLETGLGLTEGTTISSTDETTTELGNKGGPSNETTSTTKSQDLTTVLTTTEGTTISSTARAGETTIELGIRGGPPTETTATTGSEGLTTVLTTTEVKHGTTTAAEPPATAITTETTTLATTTSKDEAALTSTETSSTPKMLSTIIMTTASPETTVTEAPKTSEGTEKPTTTPDASTTIETPSTEKSLLTTTPPEITTELLEKTTTGIITTTKETTTQTTLKTTTATNLQTTVGTSEEPTINTTTMQTETTPRTTNAGRTTREITTVMQLSTMATEGTPTETRSTMESLDTTAASITTLNEAVVEDEFVNAPTTLASLDDQTQPEGEETTTPFFFETTPDFQDMPLDENNFDFNYNYDVNSVPPAYDENTVVMPNPPAESGNFNANLKRSARSVVDYVIARFYDDHSHYVPPPSQRPHYVPREPLTFAVYGKYRETGVNFMKYDTVLPYFFVPNLNAMALSFPLDSSRYYLLLLLPVRDDGVDQLICDLRIHRNLRYIIENLRLTHVVATIPSFMLKGYVTLTPTLQRLGIRKVFEPRQADFSPMTNVTDIYVTNIEQAVTVTIRNYLDPSSQRYKNFRQYPPVNFKADHPFLYFVIDSDLHVALMVGKVINPLNSRIS